MIQEKIPTTMPEWLNEKLSDYISKTLGAELSENQRFELDDFCKKQLEEFENKIINGLGEGIPIGIFNGGNKK